MILIWDCENCGEHNTTQIRDDEVISANDEMRLSAECGVCGENSAFLFIVESLGTEE